MKRRIFLHGLAASSTLAGFTFPLAGIAAGNALNTWPINDRITVINGAGGNAVLFEGASGLTLVDSGAQEHSTELLALVDQLSNKAPITTAFNTHWHEDHTGGNEALHARGVNILAHENTKLWLGADFYVEWREWGHKPRPKAALPDQTFYVSGEKDLGGEIVQYHHVAQAHTDGDIYLYFPDSNVMVAGGLLANAHYPICDIATGGWIGGLIAANADMLKIADDNTIIIPDRGPALTKADLQAQHDMLADLYEQMKVVAREGSNGDDMLRNKLTARYDEKWGDPEEFVQETYRGMWAHTYDMGGFI